MIRMISVVGEIAKAKGVGKVAGEVVSELR
jgi:hypothetical protein